MYFCTHREVGKKIQRSSMKKDIKMQFRGTSLLVYEYAKILISTSDSWPALFTWGMYQDIGHEMFWFTLISSDVSTCSPAGRKTSVQLGSDSSFISRTIFQLTLNQTVWNRVGFVAFLRSTSCSTSTCQVICKLKKNYQMSFETYLHLEDTKKMQVWRPAYSSETRTRKAGSRMQPVSTEDLIVLLWLIVSQLLAFSSLSTFQAPREYNF